MSRFIKNLFFAVIIFFSLILLGRSYNSGFSLHLKNLMAGPYFEEKIKPEDLKKVLENRKIRVLIVPGHDNENPGAVFGGVEEADLNLDLGLNLFYLLKEEAIFEPFITRKEDGNYNDWFAKYMDSSAEEIVSFRDKLKKSFSQALRSGEINALNNVFHNPAADNTSIKLYAVNKVANDHNIDIVLHIHFNDYPRKNKKQAGKYSGFAIYLPESQLPNARVSKVIGEFLEKRLSFYNPGSNLKGESSVLVEDQELIAVGSNGSRDGVSILMEYAYIYEPQIQNEKLRPKVLKELAYQTYLGLSDYFLTEEKRKPKDSTTILFNNSHDFSSRKNKSSEEAMALQYFLRKNGFYPPSGKSFNDCPISGIYGQCTEAAVLLFENVMNLEKPDGLWDNKTGQRAASLGLLSGGF